MGKNLVLALRRGPLRERALGNQKYTERKPTRACLGCGGRDARSAWRYGGGSGEGATRKRMVPS